MNGATWAGIIALIWLVSGFGMDFIVWKETPKKTVPMADLILFFLLGPIGLFAIAWEALKSWQIPSQHGRKKRP